MKSRKGFKGFDKDLKCRDFQYEIGKEYSYTGEVELCSSGFHFCEHPLDVFSYYPPGTSRFAEVEGSGEIIKDECDNNKIACSKIKIGSGISLSAYIDMAVKFIFEKTTKTNSTENKEKKKQASNSGDYGAASNSGCHGAASNSGFHGVVSNSGDYGTASNSGYQGVASNSGDYGAASNSGKQGAAANSGVEGVAVSLGIKGKAKGILDSFLIISEWEEIAEKWHRVDVKSVKVDGKKIKANIFYILKNGKFMEAQ